MRLQTQEWVWFSIGEMFEVRAGKYYSDDEYDEGDTPYVSCKAINNGVNKLIDLPADFQGGCITIGKLDCVSFYQPSDFCATSDVNVIRHKTIEIDGYIGIFLATVIRFSEGYKWCYGRQCRIADTRGINIKLPVTDSGEPDWGYMREYIRALKFADKI